MKIKAVRKKDLKATIFFIALFLILSIPGFEKYIVLLALSFLLVTVKRNKIRRRSLIVLIPPITFSLLGLFGNCMGLSASLFTIKELILIILPPVAAIGIFTYFDDNKTSLIKDIFWALFICNLRLIPDFDTTSLLESTYSFIFGVYVVYFFCRKEKRLFLLSAVLMFFAHKRIVYAAAVISILACFMFNKLKTEKGRKRFCKLIIVGCLFASYLFIWMLHDGRVLSFLRLHNISSMGRDTIWYPFMSDLSFRITQRGLGLGYIMNKLDVLKLGSGSGNLHSDLLLAFIELGFIGFGIWIYSYYYMDKKFISLFNCTNKFLSFLLGVLIYIIIVYSTDNILIYVELWLPVNLILLDSAKRKLLDG